MFSSSASAAGSSACASASGAASSATSSSAGASASAAAAIRFSLISFSASKALALAFVSPIIVTILSALLLQEKVGLHRWLAVLAGFIGALICISLYSSKKYMEAQIFTFLTIAMMAFWMYIATRYLLVWLFVLRKIILE